ncbi:MAG: DUF563 domain-containing protein [Selenomonadaceae bacterium]|nr:DUF563 domain-containing protein [Selenomonadaceae bacterium]
MFYHVWGHVITDNIRRLWFLNNDVFRNEFKNCPIVYIPWFSGSRPIDSMPDARRLLEILGVDFNRLRPITQPTRFDKIIMFDDSYVFNSYFTNEYREMIDRVRNFALKNRTPTSSKKIYFFYGKNQIGEERLAEYFKSKGYEIITHEKRANFDEELNLLINCESFASTGGSCAHNSVFLRDNMETIFIPRAAGGLTGYQERLNQVHPLNANYIDSTMSIFNVGHDSYCFIISEQLKRFFGDKWNGYEEEDFKTFLDYVNSPIRKCRRISNHVKNYNTVFKDFMAQLKRHKDLIASYNMPSDWDTFRSVMNYQTYVHTKGWGSWINENQVSDEIDKKLDIQAIKINFPKYKVYYSVYYNEEEGWSQEVTTGQVAGTTGKRKSIYGLRIRFDEAGAKEFDILYRMHTFDGEWTPWAKNGENLYSHKQRLNAIQIKLEPVKSVDTNAKEFNYTQSFLTENNEIYLQGQRQNIIQLNF